MTGQATPPLVTKGHPGLGRASLDPGGASSFLIRGNCSEGMKWFEFDPCQKQYLSQMDPKNDEKVGSMICSLISNLESFIQEAFRQELGLNWKVYILLGWRGVSHFGRCFFIILHISSRTLLHFLHILHALLHFLHIRRCTHNHLSPLAKTDVAAFNRLCVLSCLLKVCNIFVSLI